MLKKFSLRLIWRIWNYIVDIEFWIWCIFEIEFLEIIAAGNLEKEMLCKKRK